MRGMRCAVVGHVEWVELAHVPRMPEAGSVVHADEVFAEPAGGGAVVARQLALLAGRAELFTALGRDELGRRSDRRLAELGVDVHVRWGGSTRRAWTHLDSEGERTITVLGDKLLPRWPLPLDGYDLVFFVSGDAETLRAARAAPFLAASAREQSTLHEAGVALDLLVGSARDRGERYDGTLDVATLAVTEGAQGSLVNGTRYEAIPVPAPIDSYGAGDSFGAALAFALARGDELEDAVALAARAGAAVVGDRGPYAGQLAAS